MNLGLRVSQGLSGPPRGVYGQDLHFESHFNPLGLWISREMHALDIISRCTSDATPETIVPLWDRNPPSWSFPSSAWAALRLRIGLQAINAYNTLAAVGADIRAEISTEI